MVDIMNIIEIWKGNEIVQRKKGKKQHNQRVEWERSYILIRKKWIVVFIHRNGMGKWEFPSVNDCYNQSKNILRQPLFVKVLPSPYLYDKRWWVCKLNKIKLKNNLKNNFCTHIHTHTIKVINYLQQTLLHSYMPYIELRTAVKKL